VQIFDISGRLILDQAQHLINGTNEVKLDQLNSTGIYTLLIVDKTSGSFKSFKFQR